MTRTEPAVLGIGGVSDSGSVLYVDHPTRVGIACRRWSGKTDSNDMVGEYMGEETLYSQLGGEKGVRMLVDRFYELMDELPEAKGIRELHPPDLTVSADKLFMFLSGFFGGPALYVTEFGHPRLRARHLPFPIGVSERDQWVLCMETALQEVVVSDPLRLTLLGYFKRTADHMRNLHPEPEI